MPFDSRVETENNELVAEAIRRGVITIDDLRVTYRLQQQRSYSWNDPEEWVRAHTLAWLIIERDYPPARIRTEVSVPRRTPSDWADIVVYRDDQCRVPYLVVENKPAGQPVGPRDQWIEQLFGNANSLRAPLGLFDEGDSSLLFDVAGFPATERELNRRGERSALPSQYGEIAQYAYVAGQPNDITAVDSAMLGSRIRRAHYIIWAGGRRDPLLAFDEWSKLLFAKVIDERTTPTGQPRRFQFGNRETSAAVANRVHILFREASRNDPSIFPPDTRINLSDAKIAEVVKCLQSLSFTRSDVDSVGRAFEEFFGSVFRGELGQYFTMRQLARFTVAVCDIRPDDYVLDPTAGSGGFLLEALLQTWHAIDRDFAGQSDSERGRLKLDFSVGHVYGIEIHEILARICKINLLLHHDGHTNIEADRSCLDSHFTNPRLNNPQAGFSCVVGNPPFGDVVAENDEDHLGANRLANFEVAEGRTKVDSEQVILERSIQFLEPGGRLGLVIPDGMLNNQGVPSNCPQTRLLLAKHGRIEAIVSLPDHAFRKSGAQNKTSILFFRKFTTQQKRTFDRAFNDCLAELVERDRQAHGRVPRDLVWLSGKAIVPAIERAHLDYEVFLAEANQVGYTPSGSQLDQNDLYRSGENGSLAADQSDTILGEWRMFLNHPGRYTGRTQPDCMSINFSSLWSAHQSHRLDPKYHLFQHEAQRRIPDGWVKDRIGNLMRHRTQPVADFANEHIYTVLTISNTGEIRARPAGKGNNPVSWTGDYFAEVSPGQWFSATAGDVVFSSIDLWKGCIALVPPQFDGGLVTKEFPIYEVIDHRLTPRFLQTVLRSRYYQRAFRAITTGHSNRRRTQIADFEALEIAFPPDPAEQERLITTIIAAQEGQRNAAERLKRELLMFSDLIDGRGAEELPEIDDDENEAVPAASE